MASKGKGKEVAGKSSSGKRKAGDDDKTGGGRKRKNLGVLQFFEDVAAEADDSDSSGDSIFDDEFFEDEFATLPKVQNEPGKAIGIPVFPKEEEMDEEEFDRMMEDRYKDGSKFTYTGDDYELKRSVERNFIMPSAKDPTIWKVKCMVGRERHAAFCLIQKYVDLRSLGTKLQIISAFAVEHIKGFIYIEAEKQCDVIEACKGLSSIYTTRAVAVPRNEVSHLLSVRSKYNEFSEGMWARVKNGKYKGDVAQVVAVNDTRKRATVKLIPRIDLQALAEKYGGGVTLKKTATPAPRLISSSELEEFRPLIQYRRDRDTGMVFENLDGLMLKDGYLYKKVSIDSLRCSGIVPSEDELLKFKPSENEESNNLEWLSQLFGERTKKQRIIKIDKGGGKGKGSSSSSVGSSFEVHDLVCFGRKDFGLIIGMEKDESYKIMKEGSEGPAVVTMGLRELKNGLFDTKFSALDQRMKTISLNDTVRVLEGPSKGRQGIVKQIYRGTIFLYDENEMENDGYFCSKSQMCEKVKHSVDACKEKGGESGAPCFEDFLSSPKSPLSPKKPWEARENNRDFNHGDKGGMFSIGQTLRIRTGHLKGYLCRVIAIRRSDVTVKLDSQQKILTVKCEDLSEVRGKSSAMCTSEDPESSSFKPFDLLGTESCSGGWVDGAGTSGEGNGWNAGGLSAERTSWPSFPASSFSLQTESNSSIPADTVGDDSNKDGGDAAWERKVTSNPNSSWATAVADDKAVSNSEQVGGWGTSEDCWNKATTKTGFDNSATHSWEKAMVPTGDPAGSSKDPEDNWSKEKLKIGSPAESSHDAATSWGKNKSVNDNQEDCGKKSEDPWGKGKNIIENSSSSWGEATARMNQPDSWGKGKDVVETGSWEKNKSSSVGQDNWNNEGTGLNQQRSWDKGKDEVSGNGSAWGKAVGSRDKGIGGGIQEDSWGRAAEKWNSKEGPRETKGDWKSSTPAAENQSGRWGNAGGSWAQPEAEITDEAGGWKKAKVVSGSQTSNRGNTKNVSEDATGWSKGGFSNKDETGNWNKPKTFGAAGGDSWNKDGGSSWNKQDGGSSWSKAAGGSSWSKQADVNTEDESKRSNQSDSWNRPKSFGGDQGFDGWNKGRMENKNDTNQQDSWERPKTFDGGRGSGGRRGRGGRGGRDQFGRGSFGGGQSSGWNKGQENNWTSDGTSLGNASNAGGSQPDWGNKSGDSSNKDRSSSWNDKFTAHEETGGTGDNGGGWNSRKSSDGGSATGWGQNNGWKSGSTDAGRNQDSNTSLKSNWNSGSSDAAGGSQDSGWGKKSNWNSGSGDAAGGSQDSGWGKKSNWNSGSGDAGGNQDTNWGKKSSWNSGNAFGDNQSIAGQSENQTDSYSNRTSGGNWRGGFGGRGGSDRGGFRGRGGSDRGGFRGRGDGGGFGIGGDTGGFGGRGRGRRDQSSTWNNRNDSGADKCFGWNKGANNNGEGWKSNDGSVSWNQGGGGKGQWQTWKSVSGGSSNQAGGLDSKGSSWNQQSSAQAGSSDNQGWSGWKKGTGSGSGGATGDQSKDTGATDASAGGWNKATTSTDEAGGSKDQVNNWKSPDASNGGQLSNWNQSAVAKDVRGGHDQGGGWNKGMGSSAQAGGSDNQGWSGWKRGTGSGSGGATGDQSKDTGATDASAGGWNKATTSTDEAAGSKDQVNNWKSSDASNGGQLSSWNQSAVGKEVRGGHDQGGGGWNKGMGSRAQAGGWDNPGSGLKRGTGSGSGDTTGDQAETGNESSASDGGQISGWGQPPARDQSKDGREGTNGGGEPTNSWGKAAASSWGKGNDGSGKGGW